MVYYTYSFEFQAYNNKLVSIQKRDGSKGKLRIIKWITSHEPTQCADFAHKLLVNKLSVKEIHTKHQNDKDEFVRAVLKRWISKDDGDEDEESLECTWEALVISAVFMTSLVSLVAIAFILYN